VSFSRSACLAAGTLAAAIALAQSPPPRMAKDADWSLRLPKEEKVLYRGAISFQGGTAGAFAGPYPAPNVAGFLAAIVTHAVIADSAQARQRQQVQDQADRVLSYYQPVLKDYQYKELMQKGLEKVSASRGGKLIDSSEKPAAGWLIESAPVFIMTQDQRAIILDNAIAIYAPDAAENAAYKNVIRVVSQPQTQEDVFAFWSADGGAALKRESAALLAASLDLALAEATGTLGSESPTHKTFRYPEGSAERMERGQLVSEQCNRVVMRNLRGWLMSIPARQPAPDDCGGATAAPKS
jgi:hypothetical protein